MFPSPFLCLFVCAYFCLSHLMRQLRIQRFRHLLEQVTGEVFQPFQLLQRVTHQRLTLARALIHRPRLLLLDEPLGALDALTRIEMQGLIERLWQQHDFTVLLVTHDVSEAVTVADRVILIEQGEIGLDLQVDLPRPRRKGSVRLAELEAEVLERVLTPSAPASEARRAQV